MSTSLPVTKFIGPITRLTVEAMGLRRWQAGEYVKVAKDDLVDPKGTRGVVRWVSADGRIVDVELEGETGGYVSFVPDELEDS